MSKLPLTIAVSRYDHVTDVLIGAVPVEGIDLNPHYKYVVCEWPYMRPYLVDGFDTPNARSIRDRSFNLYLNEKYGEQESKDCVRAIVKVEKYFKKQ